MSDTTQRSQALWARVTIVSVRFLALFAGLNVLGMIVLVCADVLLRLPVINKPFIGAYDLVRILSALALTAALPYTTAIKGHVAIEFFFHKLGRKSRIVVDSMMRSLSIILFGFLGWRCIVYGTELYRTNQVSQTLRLPLFWLPLFIAICCFLVVLVLIHHLIYPNREMIKP